MRIAVLGAGAIGSLVGAKLVEAGFDVLMHGRGDHGAMMAISGLKITGEWDFRISDEDWVVTIDEAGLHPQLENTCDFAIITAKAKDTRTLAEIAKFISSGPVLSLQNGLGNLEILQDVLGPHRCAVGVTTNAVFKVKAGEIKWVAKGLTQIGGICGDQFATLLQCIGAEFVEDVDRILWSKLLLNVAINPLAAMCGLKNGKLLEPELFDQAEACMFEAADVARMEGVNLISHQQLSIRLKEVLTSTSENICSMLQDVRNGKETEIEMLCGEVVKRGERAGVPTPLNALLLVQIKSIL